MFDVILAGRLLFFISSEIIKIVISDLYLELKRNNKLYFNTYVIVMTYVDVYSKICNFNEENCPTYHSLIDP